MNLYQGLVWAHIAAGSVALVSFWSAALARKGSALHKAVGKIYLGAMLAILGTAAPMSVVFLWRGKLGIGVFFAFLVLITGSSCWLSWRAIALKRDAASYFNTRYRALGWANLVSGVLVSALGWQIGNALLAGFSWVGIFIGIGMLRKARALPTARNWWLQEHYGAMLGNGVATHVAFLGVGLRSVIAASGITWLQYLPWFGPLALALLAGVYLDRRYGAKPAALAA